MVYISPYVGVSGATGTSSNRNVRGKREKGCSPKLGLGWSWLVVGGGDYRCTIMLFVQFRIRRGKHNILIDMYGILTFNLLNIAPFKKSIPIINYYEMK